MKIFLLSILSWFFISTATSQIVNIPDANFKNALLNHVPVINTNLDGEIQVSEALAFTGTMNVSSKNIVNMTGLEAFVNLTTLNCEYNPITILPVTGFSNLQNLFCKANKLSSLSLNNLTSLKVISCEINLLTSLQLSNLPLLATLLCDNNNFTTLTISNLPALVKLSATNNGTLTSVTLTNLTALTSFYCNNSYNNTSLTMNNVPALKTLDCGSNKINSLSLTNPGILDSLICGNNKLTVLPAGLSALRVLNCLNNAISSFPLDNLNNLTYLNFEGNLCTAFSIGNKPQLTEINCDRNLLTNFTISNLPALKSLSCIDNQITTLALSGFLFLQTINCSSNHLSSFTISNLPSLKLLYCYYNQLTSLSFINFPALTEIECGSNPLTNLTLNNLPLLSELGCGGSNLTSLNLPYLPALKYFSCSLSKLASLSLIDFPALERLSCFDNKITSFTLKKLPALQEFDCFQNSFSSLTLDSLPSLSRINCGKNDSLTALSLNLPSLGRLDCDSTNITTLDLSNTKVAQSFLSKNRRLQYVNFKNGATIFAGTYYYDLNQCTALQFVCGDSSELTYINAALNTQLPGQNVAVSSLCNFTPGTFNTITGTVRFDGNNNGCNSLDSGMYNVKLKINSGTDTGYSFTNTRGKYSFFVTQNPNIVTPVFENSYFAATPSLQTINFNGLGNTTTADFCVTPNGVHPDLEIVMLPLTNVRPGFNAQYKIVYRNKGNQFQSGNVTLSFDAVKLNFLSAIPNITSQTTGNLTWAYSGIAPYETRIIIITFHVNAPPVVNIGDVLAFVTVINPIPGDETPTDNTFNFNQVARSSFDPNDKDVTEGSEIDISKAGDYLHYIVRFQNTGNAAATKVVVKDSLTNNLDWNSFVPITSSHPFTANISKGNLVDFTFDNINLPPKTVNEAASQGFISFKIKPKNAITVGETIRNQAKIYFDFNAPIITNTTSTTISIIKPGLGEDPVLASVYPSPAKDHLSFKIRPGRQVTGFYLVNIQGVVVSESLQPGNNSVQQINTSALPSGVYYLVVNSVQWKSVRKIVVLK